MKTARRKNNKRDAETNQSSAAVDPRQLTRMPLERGILAIRPSGAITVSV